MELLNVLKVESQAPFLGGRGCKGRGKRRDELGAKDIFFTETEIEIIIAI